MSYAYIEEASSIARAYWPRGLSSIIVMTCGHGMGSL